MTKFVARISVVALLVSFVCVFSAYASTFNIMTEEYPPYNYTENGQLTGFSTEVVLELAKRVGHSDGIKELPWARAYRLIQDKDGQILYSMTRTEKRENMFKWVGPLAKNTWVFLAKKGSGVSVNDLEDAKKVGKIGTYKDDAAELFLKDEGFNNLASVLDDGQNALKLNAGRIDLWIVDELIGAFRAKQKGIDPSSFETIHQVKETELYVAFSKNTDDATIAKWQSALDALKSDGTYNKILTKYR